MLENVKSYFFGVVLRKYLPIGIMTGFSALGAFLVAHAGKLEVYGITYGIWPLQWPQGQNPSGPVILLELDTLRMAIITGIPALIAIVAAVFQQHTTPTTVKKETAAEPPKGA